MGVASTGIGGGEAEHAEQQASRSSLGRSRCKLEQFEKEAAGSSKRQEEAQEGAGAINCERGSTGL